jgi:hypothetical protein
VLADILLGQVSRKTVTHANLIQGRDDFDFAVKIAGAPLDVDWAELNILAREDLIRYLLGDRL